MPSPAKAPEGPMALITFWAGPVLVYGGTGEKVTVRHEGIILRGRHRAPP